VKKIKAESPKPTETRSTANWKTLKSPTSLCWHQFKIRVAFDSEMVYFCTKAIVMARQSISFTKPNDEWLKAQVDNEEYSSKSEFINDLIRQARKQQAQIDWIRAKLEKSEGSGFTDDTKDQILKQSKSLLNG
jgi:antitoxin ParD1/3/4